MKDQPQQFQMIGFNVQTDNKDEKPFQLQAMCLPQVGNVLKISTRMFLVNGVLFDFNDGPITLMAKEILAEKIKVPKIIS